MASISFSKRLFDLLSALAGLLAFSPVMTVIALAILLQGGWPQSLVLDRLYVRKQNLLLDARLVAISFAVNALGK